MEHKNLLAEFILVQTMRHKMNDFQFKVPKLRQNEAGPSLRRSLETLAEKGHFRARSLY